MLTVIDTSTFASATASFNGRRVDRCQDGTLWVAQTATSTNTEFWYSKDDGASWTVGASSDIAGATNVSLFIDLDDYAHVVWKQSGTGGSRTDGYVYYMRGTPDAGRTAWTWSAAVSMSAGIFTQTNADYPDVVAHREGTGWAVHAVVSYQQSGTSNFVWFRRGTITSGGAISFAAGTTMSADYAGAAHTHPSIDFHHTGDGKTVQGGTPHLYVGWTAGATGSGKGVRFRKAVYSGGTWTWNTEREIDNARSTAGLAHLWLTTMFDGTRAVLVGQIAGANSDVMLYERDAADTTTTSRTLLASTGTSTRLDSGSATFDSAGNVYVFGADQTGAAGTRKLNYRKWTRASATLGAITTFDSTGSDTPCVSAKRGYTSSSIDWAWTDGTSSPYDVTFDRISLNEPPTAPTLTSPVAASTVDLDATQRFTWTFSDPDSGDSQSKYDLRYRVVAAPSWTDLTGTTPNSYRDIAAGTFTANDYEWQVRTYDAAGEVGPYSASSFFTAATSPSPPSLTAPLNGETIAVAEYLVEWTTPDQDSYQLRTVADLAGAADTATVYTDTGEVVSTSARSRLVPFATNNRFEHVQHRIKDAGLWSAWSSVRVEVSYTPPAEPTVALTTDSGAGAIYVTTTNPTPGAGEPSVSSVDIYRRVSADGGDGIRLAVAAAGTWEDFTPASGVEYEYRAKANGANGTYTHSEWVGAAAEVEAGIYGSGGY